MKARFPEVRQRLGLGVGLDLPWGAPIGFTHDPVRGDVVTDRVVHFLQRYQSAFSYVFVSWQPRDRNALSIADYAAAYDDLVSRIPAFDARALHQTTFNLGALEPYRRDTIVAFTNALIERYGFRWVNEDLGLWSIHGRPLPYPLPPYLTNAGLAASIRNTIEVQQGLREPLVVEFPGFSDGTSFVVGPLHAFDFFRTVVEETGSPCTLDIGHLLSYQWLRGRRGKELYAEFERLPLDHCLEIHLSGCEIDGERFLDYHHGILMDEQLELLGRVVPMCPNLRVITYEDPKFDAEGFLVPSAVRNFDRLKDFVARWAA